MRENTERPITITCGWNRLVGTDPEALVSSCMEELARGERAGQQPPLWDGKASQRILDTLTGVTGYEQLATAFPLDTTLSGKKD
jgi:UDP-N-acetylglucosamine 2-epimerase (non-hydrolysing)